MPNSLDGVGSRVLVVDDELLIVDAVAMAFRYEGFEVAKAMTGSDALAIASSWDPDLIVLDCRLPDIEGVEVGRRLRREGSKAGILFLTAKDTLEDKIEALRSRLLDALTTQFNGEAQNVIDRMQTGVQPYLRFVRGERDRVDKTRDILDGLRQRLSALKARAQNV